MSDILKELEAILLANPLVSFVGNGIPTVPLASETNDVALYLQCTNVVPKLVRTSTKEDGYNYHMFPIIVVNVDCTEDPLRIFDVVDSLQLSLLNDSQLWNKATDRDIITVEFDNAEFYPKRGAIIAMEVIYGL